MLKQIMAYRFEYIFADKLGINKMQDKQDMNYHVLKTNSQNRRRHKYG